MSAACLATVGIGASADALDAITELIGAIPGDCGMAFLLVQHLDPADASLLIESLSAKTALTVKAAVAGESIENNCLYVVPPDTLMTVEDGCLALAAAATPSTPIDGLLRGLAADQGAWAIGVILSGPGADGALGLQAIKQQGGITFAQKDRPGMPEAALALSCVDFLLSPAGIAAELLRVNRYPYASATHVPGVSGTAQEEGELTELFGLVRDACDVDFSNYKRGTVQRRISRRVALTQAESLPAYVQLLSSDKEEAQALCRDLLIGVTQFFRDPKTYEGLSEVVLPWILEGRRPAAPVRVWVPGCASGEEVYSIAICLLEILGGENAVSEIQIFGSDLSESALTTARAAIYPDSSVRNVSAQRLQNYFVKVEQGYQLIPRVRDLCVFARHDVTRDVPFVHMDIVSCRNLLMYLDAGLQRDVIPMLHYALETGGVLILGPSESVGAFHDLFDTRDIGGCRFYSRKADVGRVPLALLPHRGQPLQQLAASVSSNGLQLQVDRIAAARFAPAAVVCDDDLNVIEFRGDTAPFLQHLPGAPSLNLKNLARPGLLVDLNSAVKQARAGGAVVAKTVARVIGLNGPCTVGLEVVPILEETGRPSFLVFMQEHAAAPAAPWLDRIASAMRPWWQGLRLAPGAAPAAAISPETGEAEQLRRQLSGLRTQLRTLSEDYDSAIEELECTSEELQSSYREFHLTHQEMTLARARSQVANDALSRRNGELERMAAEMEQTHDYADAVMQNMREPLLVLNHALRVVRANAAYLKYFNTSAQETHQSSIYDLGGGQWDIPELRSLLDEALAMHRDIRGYKVSHNFPLIGTRTISFSAVNLAQAGDPLIVVSLEDITDRELVNAQLRAASQRKDEFLAMLAHELRGPLAPMRNAMAILQRGDIVASVAGEARTVLDRQLVKTTRIVDDLLEMARITRGHIVLRKQRLFLADVMQNAIDSARPYLDVRQHALTVRLPEEAVEIDGDPERLDQVITNLLTNAAKYTEPGGSIVLKLERQGSDAVIRVIDSGIGISADLVPVIFDLFVQETRALDRSQGGLGIGLTVVREITELHGGSVEAKSSGLDKGSEFIIRLPALPRVSPIPLPESIAPELEAPDFTPRRILVVDDNADSAAMCALVLDMEGHQTRTAYDGPSALEAAKAFRPEIVFLDIGLPGMNGYEVAKHLRERSETRTSQIIALSGYGRDADRRDSSEAGFDEHLVKPAEVNQLKQAIAAYVPH